MSYTQQKPGCVVRCVSFMPARQRSTSERSPGKCVLGKHPGTVTVARTGVVCAPLLLPPQMGTRRMRLRGCFLGGPQGNPAVVTAGLALLLMLLWSMAEGVQESTSVSGSKQSHTSDLSIYNGHNLTFLGTF